jgi:hypothetical protein
MRQGRIVLVLLLLVGTVALASQRTAEGHPTQPS